MEWARNHLGEIVAASEFGVLRWGLTCPSCGEPVNRRAGAERRPHFAHYSNRAKPDCESYFPSQGVGGAAATVGARGQRVVERLRAIQAGLCLARDTERRTVDLLLRIPEVPVIVGDGSIEILTGIGSRTYSTAQLTRSRLVPLPPTSPPASCVGAGVLVSLAIHLNALVAEFGSWLNFFSGGEEGGRLLGRSEHLEWGRKYLVLSPSQLEVPLAAVGAVELDALGRLSTWFVYEVSLAGAVASSKRETMRAAARFLGREIGAGQPRAYLLQPLPHHVDIDGTIIIEDWPKTLVVRATSDAPLALATGRDSTASYVSRRTNDGFVYFEGLAIPSNEVVLTIAGRDQFVIRREASGLLAPRGLVATTSEDSWDVANCRPFDDDLDEGSMVSVECSSARLAAFLARRNPGWKLAGTSLVPCSELHEFLGGNFGDVRLDSDCESHSNAPAPHEQNGASEDLLQRRWLSWLLRRQLGAEGFGRFNLYASHSGIPLQTLLRVQGGSRLLPYLTTKPKNKG